MARLVHFAVVLALLAGGCSPGSTGSSRDDSAGDGPSPAPVAPGSAAAPGGDAEGDPSASTALVDDPPGLITCGQVVAALRDGTLMDPGVVDRIAAAGSTADAPVADAASALAGAYAAALTEAGRPGEPDAVAAVSAAAADMSGVCADSGLDSFN
jgi:hypothetical protein